MRIICQQAGSPGVLLKREHTYLAKAERRAAAAAEATRGIAAEATALGGGETTALGITEAAPPAAAEATAAGGAAAATWGVVVLPPRISRVGGHGRLPGVGISGEAAGHRLGRVVFGEIFAGDAAGMVSWGLDILRRGSYIGSCGA